MGSGGGVGLVWGGGGQGGVNAMSGVGADVGMGTKNRRYCTTYKKVLFNIKKIKKNVGGGGGAIFEPKTLSMYLKKEKRKKFDRAGIRTHDLQVRNPQG